LITQPRKTTMLEYGKFHLLCGTQKGGKTTAASTFSKKSTDGVLFLDFDHGLGVLDRPNRIHISCCLPPLIEVDGNWIEAPPDQRGYFDNENNPMPTYSIKEAIDFLRAEWSNLPYDTVVIDTIDAMHDITEDFILELYRAEEPDKYENLDSIADVSFGAGYARVRNSILSKVYEILDIIKFSGQLVILMQREKTITIEKNGKVVPQQRPAIPEKLASKLQRDAETVGIVEISPDGNYQVTYKGYGEITSGSRLEALNGKTIKFSKSGDLTLYNQATKLLKLFKEKQNAES